MKHITVRELKQYLSHLPSEELANEIVQLFTTLDAVKDMYTLRLRGGNDSGASEQYKSIIRKEFFPSRGMGQARLSVARKAVTDYKKIATMPEGVIDLMLYYVETGVQFTNTYGDINEAFYNSMESMYAQACKQIREHHREELFDKRAYALVEATRDIGWGFHDGLQDIYNETFK